MRSRAASAAVLLLIVAAIVGVWLHRDNVKPDVQGAVSTMPGSMAYSLSGQLEESEHVPRDGVLETESFVRTVLPNVIVGPALFAHTAYALPASYILKPSQAAGAKHLYLHEDCSAEDAINAQPWWSVEEVSVCPDAHAPDVWQVHASLSGQEEGVLVSCDSDLGARSGQCGCGPALLRCFKDVAQYMAMHRSLEAEVRDSVRYVFENDLPLADLYQGTYSYRDRNVEYVYFRYNAHQERSLDAEKLRQTLLEWPAFGAWKERLHGGEHAGILTAPKLLHYTPDQRQRQNLYYELLWCEEGGGFGASPRRVLELNETGNLQATHESWQRLAHAPLCNNCHARLDYGFQFFLGYGDSRIRTHYQPQEQQQTGTLYGFGIDDFRGKSERLTPTAFARLATEQPEFGECAARKLLGILEPRATSADVEKLAALLSNDEQSLKSAVGFAIDIAVEARGRDRVGDAPQSVSQSVAVHEEERKNLGQSVRWSEETLSRVDEHCLGCHDDGEKFQDDGTDYGTQLLLTAPQVPLRLAIRALDLVVGRVMPPDGQLSESSRAELSSGMARDIFGSDSVSAHYLGQHSRRPHAQLPDTFFTHVLRDPDVTRDWGILERSLPVNDVILTPNLAIFFAEAAMRGCDGLSGSELESCLTSFLSEKALLR